MFKENLQVNHSEFDAIVIGAGICGIIFLKYALEKGLNCLVLEKKNEVGGLWGWIPAWQDIQNRREDFAINNVPLEGVKQPAILKYIHAWIRKYGLDPHIKLSCKVTSVSWNDRIWKVQAGQDTYYARHLIVATGVQNIPRIPEVEHLDPQIIEMHSSRLRNPEVLKGKRITVVGGGASSWDLLDLAIGMGAKDIHWIYRNPRWFLPTTKSKQNSRPNLRELALLQSQKKSTEEVNDRLKRLLHMKYDYFKLKMIEPSEPFDLKKHQLIPGRSLLVKNLDLLSHHRSEVNRIHGHEIFLKNGDHFETDILLWATGYRMDLSYLGLPEYIRIETLKELRPRLGSMVRSLDYPNLFFIGMSLIESTSSTPFFAAIEAKSMVAHILGKCEIPERNIPYLITHWDLFKHFASFDHYNYPVYWWKIRYFFLVWWYALFPDKSIKI
jgi:hypothetical protein